MDLVRRMGSRWSVGYTGIFDESLPADATTHVFDELFAMPQRFREDLRIEDFSHAPTFSPAAEEAAQRFVRERVAPGDRILFLHPETRIEKMWQPESFSWVVERFLSQHPEFKVFVASIAPYPLAIGRHCDRIFPLKVHLELALAIMRHADLYLGIDSCFLHAADLFRMPGVGLFGPTNPRQWGFRFSAGARVIWAKGPMEGIRRELVLEALLETAAHRENDSRAVRADTDIRSRSEGSPMRCRSASSSGIAGLQPDSSGRSAGRI